MIGVTIEGRKTEIRGPFSRGSLGHLSHRGTGNTLVTGTKTKMRRCAGSGDERKRRERMQEQGGREWRER